MKASQFASRLSATGLCAAWLTMIGCGQSPTTIPADGALHQVTTTVAVAKSPSVVATPATVAPAAPAPQAKPLRPEFDFGAVEPLHTHKHTFEICNLGDAPLTLAKDGSSCKCLEIESVTDVVPPGEVGKVVIAWTAKASQDAFLQRVMVKTNDPKQPSIELKVIGQALQLFASYPPELIISRVKPDAPATVSGVVFSQVLDSFRMDEFAASRDDLRWKVSPATPQQLADLSAKSGWNVEVTVPDNLPQGSFAEWLRFTAHPTDGSQEIDAELTRREVTIRGRVLRRISVFGEGIDFGGTLDLGVLTPGTAFERVLTVRVQDRDTDLNVTSVTAEPGFVTASLEPFDREKAPGLYRLKLRIPPDAAPGYYRGEALGKLRLTFDHPRIDALDLALSFVVPNERPRLHQLSMASEKP